MRNFLPNDELEEFKLIKDLAIEVQYSDASPPHARPGCKAKIEAVLQGTLANGNAALQLGSGYRWESIFPVQHWIPLAPV